MAVKRGVILNVGILIVIFGTVIIVKRKNLKQPQIPKKEYKCGFI